MLIKDFCCKVSGWCSGHNSTVASSGVWGKCSFWSRTNNTLATNTSRSAVLILLPSLFDMCKVFLCVCKPLSERGASCEHLKLGISQKKKGKKNRSPFGWRRACTISTSGGSLAGFQLLQRHRGGSAVHSQGQTLPATTAVMMPLAPQSASACYDLPCVQTLPHYATGQRAWWLCYL